MSVLRSLRASWVALYHLLWVPIDPAAAVPSPLPSGRGRCGSSSRSRQLAHLPDRSWFPVPHAFRATQSVCERAHDRKEALIRCEPIRPVFPGSCGIRPLLPCCAGLACFCRASPRPGFAWFSGQVSWGSTRSRTSAVRGGQSPVGPGGRGAGQPPMAAVSTAVSPSPAVVPSRRSAAGVMRVLPCVLD